MLPKLRIQNLFCMVGEHCSAVEGISKEVLEVLQELMLTRVAKMRVKNPHAENLRFPVVKLIFSGLVDP